jgi:hypothetical protein
VKRSYANWTNDGWSVRFHGNVYKQPNISESKLDDLANIFLIGTDIKNLSASEQTMARNLTSEIFVLQQSDIAVSFELMPAETVGASGQKAGSGAIIPTGYTQNITFPR